MLTVSTFLQYIQHLCTKNIPCKNYKLKYSNGLHNQYLLSLFKLGIILSSKNFLFKQVPVPQA